MATYLTVDDPSHPLAADYVALNDPTRRRAIERRGGYFVVEGILAIGRLLEVGDWTIRSMLLLPSTAERLRPHLDAVEVDVGVADEAVLRAVVGFDLHRGALASVERRPELTLAELPVGGRPLVVAEGVNDHENLGALYRNAAAFGVGAVVLDPTSADPFYRRSVRVSMGHVLAVPTVRSEVLPAGLDALHAADVTTVALTPKADVEIRDLAPSLGDRRVAVLVGAEGPGLTEATLSAATHRAAIRMRGDVDSLNVATAAAIALHHLDTSIDGLMA